MKTECLDYRVLPAQPPLFLDFLYRWDRVQDCYRPVHQGLDQLKQRIDRVLRRPPPFPRDELMRLLAPVNRRLGAPEAVLKNLEKLRSSGTVAVIAGQQPGLLGGPAYSVYKAATAVRLAKMLETEGLPAVPVFWVASDDSDFREVRSTHFFDSGKQLLEIGYPLVPEPDRMVGTVHLEAVSSCLEELGKHDLAGEFGREVGQLLERAYEPSRTFAGAFGAWLLALFGSDGLILFDPLEVSGAPELAGFYRTAIEKRERLVGELQKRGDLLRQRGYEPQVHLDPSETFLFWRQEGRRLKLQFRGNRYRARRELSLSFEPSELLEIVSRSPERVGTNVLLRPILQEYLFPTAAYVGGAAEVAYFAQVSSIERFWNREVAIFPRAGVTVVDRKAQRLLRKYGLPVEEILTSTLYQLCGRLVRAWKTGDLVRSLDSLDRELADRLDTIRGRLEEEDPPVAEMLETAGRKIHYQIEKVRRRVILNQREKNGVLESHLAHLRSHLLPAGGLQERFINFNYFLCQEGPGFAAQVARRIQPFCLAHQLVYV